MAPYNATKAAVVALSEALRGEVGHLGIHVTVLCPSFFVTNIIRDARGPSDPRDAEEATKLMERSRVQAPDVARAALEAVANDQLYCVPMLDGRLVWRLKRLWPWLFSTVTAAAYRRRLKK